MILNMPLDECLFLSSQVPEWCLDDWHPSEKAMYPDYFAKREQWKKLRRESWEREVSVPAYYREIKHCSRSCPHGPWACIVSASDSCLSGDLCFQSVWVLWLVSDSGLLLFSLLLKHVGNFRFSASCLPALRSLWVSDLYVEGSVLLYCKQCI